MESDKWSNRTKIACAIIGLIGICVGTFGTLIIKPNVEQSKPIPPDHSLVQQFQGVYLYIRSKPENVNYTSLGIINANSLTRAVENANHKKGFGNILESVGKSVVKDLSFENRLSAIIEGAKNYNPEVQGVIFLKDLTECELIKFNK
ncbi:MAG TPA: hypothetical protein VJY62_00790 [Bacteroidia bacterium]|nr:hypothetical protein [Bacteroidia bacterium]